MKFSSDDIEVRRRHSPGSPLPVDDRGCSRIEGEITWMKKFSDDYTIIRVICDDFEERRIVGTMPPLQIGEKVTVMGKKESHQQYGDQYKVTEFVKSGFVNKEALIKYLSGKEFPEINKTLADRLVKHFGENILSILDSDPSKVREVSGIGKVRENAIIESYTKHREQHRAMSKLITIGLPATVASKALKHFGGLELAVEAVTLNPYSIIELEDVGWQIADEFAQRSGMRANDDRRCAAAIVHIAGTARSEGHCFYVYSALAEGVQELVQYAFTQKQIMEQVNVLIELGKIVRDGDRIYPTDLYFDETRASQLLAEMVAYESLPIYSSEEEMLEDLAGIEGFKHMQLAEKQVKAVMYALNHRVAIVTGPPGTGKTTILKAITALFERNFIEYKLCAPTGRASKRMNESTGKISQTVHRLLEYDKETHGFLHKAGTPLKTDAVICDETSMLDVKLTRFMLEAMERDDRLIFVGDHNQLPSVGPGNVLKDIIRSRQVPTVVLNQVFRQGDGSYIVDVAHSILRGETPDIPTPDKLNGRNCLLLPESEVDQIRARLGRLITEVLPSKGFSMDDLLVLTPMRVNALGANSINQTLQEYINPPTGAKTEVKTKNCILREGDRVMMVRNDYNKGDNGVYNGDIGILKQIVDGVLCVKFPEYDYLVEYEETDYDKLQLAYVSTVHKAQGSEAKCVVLILHPSHTVMLKRNLVYTAITRAKEMCVIVGTKGALDKAVGDNREFRRNTALAERISTEIDLTTPTAKAVGFL